MSKQQPTSAQNTTVPGTVRASITQGNWVTLDPAVDAVAELLAYPSVDFEAGSPLGYQPKASMVELSVRDRCDRLVFPGGLWHRAHALLEELGYSVVVEDQRKFGKKYRVDEILLHKQARPKDRPFLEAIAQHPQGLIEVQRSPIMLRQITLICQLFFRARILIAVPTTRVAYRIWQHLDGFFSIEKVHLVTETPWRTSCRILVGTYKAVTPKVPQDWQVVLLPYAEQATGEVAVQMVQTLSASRTYAFVSAAKRHDLRTQLRLEAMAGPVIYAVKPPPADVRVVVDTVSGTEKIEAHTALERKRQLWHDDARNRAVATVARALASRNKNALRHCGLNDTSKDKLPDGPVVVLVESVEHGRALLAHLPGWRLDHALPDEDSQSNDKHYGQVPEGTIVTAVRAAKDVLKAGIVIRATGGGWPLTLPGFPPPRDEHPRGVLLVDFADTDDIQAAKDSQRRLADYQRRGWYVMDAEKSKSER